MKRKLLIAAIVLLFIAGVAIMSYPLVSSAINNAASRSRAQDYTETVKKLSGRDNSALWSSAEKYNKSLNDNVVLSDPFDEEAYQKIGEGYENALDVDGSGLIGYVEIPKINVYLPVYHGTASEVLSHGAGHMRNTSLPVGGESTHAVISAHSAYPGETFFDYLTDMEEGDEFYIHVLDRTLKYEVDSIKVILPDEVDNLRIVSGEDYVTLMTCTPYSVNTHRLLVRGKRVEYDDSLYITTGSSAASFDGGYLYLLGYRIPYWAAAAAVAATVAAAAIIVILFIRRSKKRSGNA